MGISSDVAAGKTRWEGDIEREDRRGRRQIGSNVRDEKRDQWCIEKEGREEVKGEAGKGAKGR